MPTSGPTRRKLHVASNLAAWLALSALAQMAAAAPGDSELVSVTADGTQAAGGHSIRAAINGDGRYVAFMSWSRDLVSTLTTMNGSEVYLRDMDSMTARRVSAGVAMWPAISRDGRFVAYMGDLSKAVPGTINQFNIGVWDRVTGVTEMVNVSSTGEQAEPYSYSQWPAISGSGRYVAFHSEAANLVPGDVNAQGDVFLRDRQAGVTELISVGEGGVPADGKSDKPSISADGRYVAFYSAATNLVAGDTNGFPDVFVRDRVTGVTERVSIGSNGAQANAGSWRWGAPAISADGRYVAFTSEASNLHATDTNESADVFVRDRQRGTTERISIEFPSGFQSYGNSESPSISDDGRFVAFESQVNNIYVYVRDRATQETAMVSVDSAGSVANDRSETPSISADGRWVAFNSRATNLAANDYNDEMDVYRHELVGANAVPAQLTLKPDALRFGDQPVGTARTLSFWLRNKGPADLLIARLYLRGADRSQFHVGSTCGERVEPLETCRIRVTFQPSTAGEKSAVVRLETRDGTRRTRSVSGTGIRQ